MKRNLNKYIPATLYFDYALLFCVFFLVFFVPFFPPAFHPRLYNIFITLIYITATFAVGGFKKSLAGFAFATIVLEWLSSLMNLALINEISKLFSVIFFVIIVILFIVRVAKAKNVDAKLILDAVNGYLLLSIVYSIIVALIMNFNPEAFNFPLQEPGNAKISSEFVNYIYYSLVSISTLGYGDIVPVAPYAKSLATFISLSGQFYIAILMALIVGKYAAKKA